MDQAYGAFEGEGPYIFVSYAHKDSDLVFSEIEWLRDQGFQVWYDAGISPGSRWSDELATALKNSTLFLFFSTANSVNSRHCQDEINLALDSFKHTIAVHLQETELTPGLQLRLSSHQAILKYKLSDRDYRDSLMAGISEFVNAGNVSPQAPQLAPIGNNKMLVPGALGLVAIAILVVGILIFFRFPTAQPFTEKVENAPLIDTQSVSIPVEVSREQATPSIAVLPFVNMSSDPEQEFFSDGITDDILNSLVRKTDLRVIARTSSFQFKNKNLDVREIGDALNVTHILEGSVRKIGNSIRVTAQLNRTNDGSHVWSEQYDRELVDVFRVQDEITQRISQALSVKFLDLARPSQKTVNLDAHSAFLLGRYHNSRFEFPQAIQALEKSIELAPDSAEPYALLSFVHMNLNELSLASDFRDTAMKINPLSIVARAVNAHFVIYIERDYQSAIDELAQLSQMGDPYRLMDFGQVLFLVREFDLAVKALDQAVRLDPLSPLMHDNRAHTLAHAGRFKEAAEALRTVESLGSPAAHHFASLAGRQGDVAGIQAQLARDNTAWGNWARQRTYFEALVLYLTNDKDGLSEKLRYLNQTLGDERFGIRIDVALLAEDTDLAIAYLEQGLSTGDGGVFRFLSPPLHGNPLHTDLYNDLRYQKLVERAGLDAESLTRLKIPELSF